MKSNISALPFAVGVVRVRFDILFPFGMVMEVWSEANPQVYVETPLYREKLTVWCALWAGGILLQKR
ncbi:hypothetical protein TNCV_2551871 [Trichonephila clavipes]|nr:hypothetical protein TNCV_2551871 [Trichonephila clavipes]